MMLPVQSQGVARSDTAITTRDLNQILQPNAEQSARVVNSRQDPVSPTLFRVALEVGNQRLEVMTNRPLAEGLTVLLSRDARGDVALRLPTPAPAQPTPAQTQALNQLGTQANQFIAMIAPESRAQAQQLLTQTQMTALVQPQVSNPAPLVGNPLANRVQAAPPTTTAVGAEPTSPPATQTGAISSQNAQPSVQGSLATGGIAAANAAANQAPVEAIRAIQGDTGQGQQAQQGASSPQKNSNQSANPTGAQTPTQNSGQTGSQTQQPTQAVNPGTPSPSTANIQNTASQTSTQGPQIAAGVAAQTGAQVGTQPAAASLPNAPAGAVANSTAPGSTSIPNAPPGITNQTPVQPPIQASNQTQPVNQTAAQAPQSLANQSHPTPTQTGIALARVVDAIDPKMSSPAFARTTINLGGETLNIVTPRPLLAGQQVEVTRLSDMALQVRILPPQAAKILPTQVVEEMQALLRQAMPLQAPLADSLNQMRALSTGQGQDAVGQIVRSLMGLFSLSPQSGSEAQAKQVEQMMQQSGLFTENRMARQASGAPMSVEDLRTRLGQLRRAVQELPTQAREQMNALIDRAEARATHQQIHSARQWRDYPDGTAERYFRMDLPLQTPEGFKQVELELKEQRRPTSPTETQTNWTLNLHFDLDPIGAVDARVHLEDEWDMSISFWAESLRTMEMIRDRIESFSTHLQQQGFEIDSINVRKGRAPNNLAPALSKHLVDVHT